MQKNKGEKSMEKTVKEIFKEGKAINLMTPVGYIYLNADQVKKVMSDEKKVIMNAGARGTEMLISTDYLFSCVVVEGGYNPANDTNEYLVDNITESLTDV